jgi:hypothetical protein
MTQVNRVDTPALTDRATSRARASRIVQEFTTVSFKTAERAHESFLIVPAALKRNTMPPRTQAVNKRARENQWHESDTQF